LTVSVPTEIRTGQAPINQLWLKTGPSIKDSVGDLVDKPQAENTAERCVNPCSLVLCTLGSPTLSVVSHTRPTVSQPVKLFSRLVATLSPDTPLIFFREVLPLLCSHRTLSVSEEPTTSLLLTSLLLPRTLRKVLLVITHVKLSSKDVLAATRCAPT
jgi:hypothetical protein